MLASGSEFFIFEGSFEVLVGMIGSRRDYVFVYSGVVVVG